MTIEQLLDLDWQRREQPVLSAMTTRESWCRVQLYSPAVVKARGRYHMWYIGNDTETRMPTMSLGYAVSGDGVQFEPHPGNPILPPADLPRGRAWQTPHVLFDSGRFRMWFVMADGRKDERGRMVDIRQQLGYAESRDGVHWEIAPEPLYPTGRGPCVVPLPDGTYRMWMNSAPEPDDDFSQLVSYIYGFASDDGLVWRRDERPAVCCDHRCRSVVYPFVLAADDGWVMWHGSHVVGVGFEIYAAVSADGEQWTPCRETSCFSAAGDPNRFDGRYTSTPCVVDDGNRLLMYYSACDCGNLYGSGDGRVLSDSSGIYRHIGVATAAKRG